MTRVAGSSASAASPCSIVMPPISSLRSRPPVPSACDTPPPALWIRHVTSCKPVPDAATSPMSPRRTTLAKPSGTPLTIAVPQSGPMTMRSWSRAYVLIVSSSATETLSEKSITLRPDASALQRLGRRVIAGHRDEREVRLRRAFEAESDAGQRQPKRGGIAVARRGRGSQDRLGCRERFLAGGRVAAHDHEQIRRRDRDVDGEIGVPQLRRGWPASP